MIRKQVYLTTAQNERLRRAARQQRRSEAELLREAIDRQLGGGGAKPATVKGDPLFGLVGVGSSGEGNLSERVDEILYGRHKT